MDSSVHRASHVHLGTVVGRGTEGVRGCWILSALARPGAFLESLLEKLAEAGDGAPLNSDSARGGVDPQLAAEEPAKSPAACEPRYGYQQHCGYFCHNLLIFPDTFPDASFCNGVAYLRAEDLWIGRQSLML